MAELAFTKTFVAASRLKLSDVTRGLERKKGAGHVQAKDVLKIIEGVQDLITAVCIVILKTDPTIKSM